MTATPVSVVIVSRDRPEALARCIEGIARLDHPHFEVIVVADPVGIAGIRNRADRIKTVTFDRPNIAAARNLGLAAAAGEVVAFIDDDAVPEPTWLSRLTAPFADPGVDAAGGYVIGRNGITFQWTASAVDRLGQRLPLAVDPAAPSIHRGSVAIGIKTEGTNMAFRRDALVRIGGFDERFAYYLDETDVNLRLGALGARTAIVPRAQVHHGFAESARRRRDRVPRDLTEVGASLAVFLHKSGADPATRLAAERDAQRRRLVAHFVAGRLEQRDIRRLLATFDAGWAQGLQRAPVAAPDLATPSAAFLPFAANPPPGRHVALPARPWTAGPVRAQAAALAAEGATVTVLVLSPTALYHRVAFQPEGYWLQTGGLFGRSDRRDPLFCLWRFGDRVAREVERVAPVRIPGVAP